MESKLTTVAIAYDFDGTLAPGNMQEHSFIPKLGIDNTVFWQEANELAKKHDGDEILAYMILMLKKATEKGLLISRDLFKNLGKEITFFKGVESFFDRVNQYASFKGINPEHHIISSGVRDLIQGTSIAGYFKNIFASGYIFDENDIAVWPALAINYTTKTQYLFRINKGIDNSYDNRQINKFIEYEKRPVPFNRMIYIGDGETDVPAMKMIKLQGGTAIAVYDPDKQAGKDNRTPKDVCEELIHQKRADFIAPADYSPGSRLEKILFALLNRISEDEILRNI